MLVVYRAQAAHFFGALLSLTCVGLHECMQEQAQLLTEAFLCCQAVITTQNLPHSAAHWPLAQRLQGQFTAIAKLLCTCLTTLQAVDHISSSAQLKLSSSFRASNAPSHRYIQQPLCLQGNFTIVAKTLRNLTGSCSLLIE